MQPFIFGQNVNDFSPFEYIVKRKASKLRLIAKLGAFYSTKKF
jgi:hypothetical protein